MPEQNGTVENVQSCLGIGLPTENENDQGEFESDYLGP